MPNRGRAHLPAIHGPAGLRSSLAGGALLAAALACGAALGPFAAATGAQTPVALATAGSFAVLAGSGITNTGATTVNADTGTFPTPSETGFGSVVFAAGSNQDGDSVTQAAKGDLGTAYGDAAGRSPATSVPVELGGTTLGAGVYTSPTLGLTGTLTLDANGDPNAEFVFQAGSTLTTATDSQVLLIGGADACNVVWQIGSSATFGTRTHFAGTVLAYTSITADNAATFHGRLLAESGAVTLDTNTITAPACASGPPASPTPTSSPTSPATIAPMRPAPTVPPSRPTGSVAATATATVGAISAGSGGSGTTRGTSTADRAGGADRTGTTRTVSATSGGTGSLPFTGFPALDALGAGLLLITLGGTATAVGHRRRDQR